MKELETVSAVVTETNAVSIPDAIKEELVNELKPIADRMQQYAAVAATVECTTQADAEELAREIRNIDADIKAVEGCDVLSRTISGLHGLHKKWVCLRNLFTDPMTRDKKTIRDAVRVWQTEQERLAEERRAKLQAEADAKARKERERAEALARAQREKEAEALKAQQEAIQRAQEATNAEARAKAQAEAEKARKVASEAAAKAEAREETAASVITPTVMVAAPKAIGVRRVWAVTNVDMDAFLAAAAKDPALRGYIEIDNTRLVRSKAANPALNVPGVVFELQVR